MFPLCTSQIAFNNICGSKRVMITALGMIYVGFSAKQQEHPVLHIYFKTVCPFPSVTGGPSGTFNYSLIIFRPEEILLRLYT